MPLFFFAGAAACVTSWQPGGSWGTWLMRRCTRLFRPVFYYLAFWAVALAVLYSFLPQHVYEPIAGISIQLLWFIGVYVLVLAAMPVLSRITTPARLAAGVVGVYAGIAVIDAVRLHWSAAAPLGYLNLAAWLIPGMFGVAYRRRLITGRAALGTAVVAFLLDAALLVWGPYELSLVGIEGMRLPNMSPPSLLLAGHAIALSALAIAAAPAINRWARRPRVWWFTAIGNSGAMTLYLWHMPALLAVHVLFDAFGNARYPGQPDFLAVTFEQLFIMIGVVAVLFVALRPLENNPLPGWDGAPAVTSVRRGTVVGMLLGVAAAALLAAVKWGLKDDGLPCVAVMLAALLAARLLTVQPRGINLRTPARTAASATPSVVHRVGADRVSAPSDPPIPVP
jgi:hypothetical protein